MGETKTGGELIPASVLESMESSAAPDLGA